jgi:hypothetical protein
MTDVIRQENERIYIKERRAEMLRSWHIPALAPAVFAVLTGLFVAILVYASTEWDKAWFVRSFGGVATVVYINSAFFAWRWWLREFTDADKTKYQSYSLHWVADPKPVGPT